MASVANDYLAGDHHLITFVGRCGSKTDLIGTGAAVRTESARIDEVRECSISDPTALGPAQTAVPASLPAMIRSPGVKQPRSPVASRSCSSSPRISSNGSITCWSEPR